jgi:sulfhydrogenase subunit beta (sulfur reductase)
MGKILKKEDLNKFLYKTKSQYELISPITTDCTRFDTVKFISQINLGKIPDFSPKRYLLPESEDMFDYPESKISLKRFLNRQKTKVIFGIRLCDVNAISVLDKKLLGKDPLYTQKREKIILIGIQCAKEIEKNCFCTSFSQKTSADLFFHEIKGGYYIEVKSEKGLKLVSRLKDYDYDPDRIITKKVLEKKDLEEFYDNKAWNDAAKKCTSCGICTNICPTCHCFKSDDVTGIDIKKGKIVKALTSCHFKEFWKTHDNTLLNVDKTERLKHRIYHKLHYFRKKHGVDMCTGCGRCITNCPAGIDFVKIINSLKQ